MNTNWHLIDFRKVEVVSFDVGYTILGLDAKQVSAFLSMCFNCPPISPAAVLAADAKMRHEHLLNGTQIKREQRLFYSEVLCELLEFLPGDLQSYINPERLKAFEKICRLHHTQANFFNQIYHDALAALEILHQNGVRMIVISNAHGTLHRDLKTFGLWHYFEHVLDSSAEGVAKPDPEIFTRAIDRCAVPAEAVLHIGDNPVADIEGALAIGMQAALYDPTGMFPDANGLAPQFRNHVEFAEMIIKSRLAAVQASAN